MNWLASEHRVSDGALFVRVWHRPEPKYKRLLFVVHGLGEQSSRYSHFPHYLQFTVDAVVALDLPGHGQSKGTRGHIEKFSDFSTALLAALEWTQQKFPGSQIHWYGHSFGGLVSLFTLLHQKNLPIYSIVIASPLLDFGFPLPHLKSFLARTFEPLIGGVPLKNELDQNLLSHDPEVARTYRENPLNHDRITPRLFVQMTKAMKEVRDSQTKFSYPLLMVVPMNDQVVSWQENIRFFQKIKMADGYDKALASFPGFYHEAHNEVDKAQVFVAIENWILARPGPS